MLSQLVTFRAIFSMSSVICSPSHLLPLVYAQEVYHADHPFETRPQSNVSDSRQAHVGDALPVLGKGISGTMIWTSKKERLKLCLSYYYSIACRMTICPECIRE